MNGNWFSSKPRTEKSHRGKKAARNSGRGLTCGRRLTVELLEHRNLLSATVGTSFGGLDQSYTGWGPLDPNGAVNSNFVCQIINTNLGVFSKSGQLIYQKPFSQLAAWTKNDPYGSIDPYVVFDPLAQRWVFTAGLTEVYFAVSNTADPTQGWGEFHTIDMLNATDGGRFGYNADAYVLTWPGTNDTVTIQKSSVLDQNNSTFTSYVSNRPGGAPFLMEDSQPGDPIWLNNGTSFIKMTNELSATPTFTTYTLSGVTIGSSKTAEMRNNKVILCNEFGTLNWNLVDMSTVNNTNHTINVVQSGTITPPGGYSPEYSFSSIDANGNIGINYLGTNGTAEAMFVTGRTPSDPAGTMQPSVMVAHGTRTSNRIGDYGSIFVDPNNNTFWSFNNPDNNSSYTNITNFSVTSTVPVTPLAPVTGLSATSTDSTMVNVQWNAVTGATSYNVLRTSDGMTFTTVATGLTGTSYVDSPGGTITNYTYDVMAFNSSTDSTAPSLVTASASTAAPTVNGALTVPTALAASLPASGTGVLLSWNTVAGGNGYFIWRSSNNSTWTLIATITAASTISYTDSATTAAQLCYYRISSRNSSGQQSNSSASVSIASRPGTPGGIVANPMSRAQIQLKWNAVPSATGFTIYRSTDGTNYTAIGTSPANFDSFTDTGLNTDTKYYYQVVATSSVGTNSSVTSITSATQLPNVNGLFFTVKASTQMSFQWTAVAGATGYQIQRSTDGTNFATLTTISATNYNDATVSPVNSYYYRIYAVDSVTGGSSLASAVIFAATPSNVSLPGLWQAQDLGSPVAGATGYTSSTGTFKVVSQGSDIGGTSDQFRFTYVPLSGDGYIVARLASQQNTGNFTKAGVMIRATLDALSANAATFISYTQGAQFQYRTTSGGGTTGAAFTAETPLDPPTIPVPLPSGTDEVADTPEGFDPGDLDLTLPDGTQTIIPDNNEAAVVAAPYWLEISRSGNIFTSSASTDGVTWTVLGTQTITMPTTVYMGLAADSNNGSLLNVSTFDNISMFSTGDTAPIWITPATASSGTVTGTSVNLTALATDSDSESSLTYTWAATSQPAGATAPTYSVNGTNAAKNTTATFSQAGSYTFQVTATDTYGLSSTSKVTVTVNQTQSGISVFPQLSVLLPSQTYQFGASAVDQFGKPMPGTPAVTWSVTAGAGSVSATGLYTAPSSNTTATVTATASGGGATGNATAQVVKPAGYWKLDDGSGLNAADSSGSGHPGTLVGGATWTTGQVGAGAVSLDGTTGAVSVPALNLNSNTVTMSAWVKRNGTQSNYAGIIFYRNGTGTASGLDIISSGELHYHWNDTNYNYASGLIVPDGVWTFVALVVTANNATFYMQPFGAAMQSAVNTATNATQSFSGTSYIGQDSTGGRFFKGTIDDARIYNTSLSASAVAALANLLPTVAAVAAATPSPVTGTTATLSVLGADNAGESTLTYTWAATTVPNGAAQPTYSDNATNSAKNTTVSFSKAGSYTFTVTIADSSGLSTTSSVSVTVNQTPTVVVAPNPLNIAANGTQTFSAGSRDQFGAAMSLSGWIWSASAGNIDPSTGAYTAPASHANATITATSGAYSGTAMVIVANTAPTVATPAAASPSPVTGTTTNLSVVGNDDDGEANLTYTWVATVLPGGAAAPLFSANGSNAAKNTTATFSKAGSYTFTVTITDQGGMTATSSVNVTVNQTFTRIAVSPAYATLASHGVQAFTATAYDQFSNALTSQPTFTWTTTAGSITSGGAYTAPYGTSSANVTATNGAISGTAVASTTDTSPTVATPAASSANPVTGKTTTFTVLGADADGGGEANLMYNWTALNTPSGAIAPTYSVNGTNAAKNTVVTFYMAGNYTLQVTITDFGGATTASLVNVAVYAVNGAYLQRWLNIGGGTAVTDLTGNSNYPNSPDQAGTIFTFEGPTNYADNYGQRVQALLIPPTTGSYTFWIAADDTAELWLSTDATSGNATKIAYVPSYTGSRAWNTYSQQKSITISLVAGQKYYIQALMKEGGGGDNLAVAWQGPGITQQVIDGQYLQPYSTIGLPTVAVAAVATPNPATGTTAALSVLGADDNLEANLLYTWSATGPATVTYSTNGTNAAKNTTATFTKAGAYTFTATIKDMDGFTTTSVVNVMVNQTLTGIAVSPTTANLASHATNQFSAAAYDQFGTALSVQPAFTWAVASGVGNIDGSSGLYTASYASGTATVTATSGAVTSNAAAVTVTNATPTVATPAAATPSPVSGATTDLSVLGGDSDGGLEAGLTYTWATTGTPPAAVSFSVNGTNASKSATGTFTKAGDYSFQVTITDFGGSSITSSVNVTVNQTVTTVSASPASANITAGATQQFTAAAYDQFGAAITGQSFTWAVVTGAGVINSTGLYTPPYAPASATIQAADNGVMSNTASVGVSGQAQWNASASASWSTAGSWKDSITSAAIAAPGTRGIAGDTVLFAAATGGTASLDGASPTLSGITFNSFSTSYTIVRGSGGAITLQGAAAINLLAGSHAINTPLVLAGNTEFDESTGTMLTVGGNISGGGSLTKSGAGVVELSGANTFGGGAIVVGGKLIVDNPNSLPDGGSLTIGSSGYFSAPTVASPVAVVSPQVASTAASVPAAIIPPAPDTRVFVKATVARATVLNQVKSMAIARTRIAALFLYRVGPPNADSSGQDFSADRSARIRDAIFVEYGRD